MLRELENIQRKFVAISYIPFFSAGSNVYSYASSPQHLNLRTLLDRRHQLHKIFVFIFLEGGRWCVLDPVHLPWKLLAYDFELGTSKTFLCFMLVHPSKRVSPPGVPLCQIQFIVILTSSESKSTLSVRFHFILSFIS